MNQNITIEKDLYQIYQNKARIMRTNFNWAIKLQCGFDHPLFKETIREIINIDTPVELLKPLNKLAHNLVTEFKQKENEQ